MYFFCYCFYKDGQRDLDSRKLAVLFGILSVGVICFWIIVLSETSHPTYEKCSICHREMKCYICDDDDALYCGQAEGVYGHYCEEHCHFIWD